MDTAVTCSVRRGPRGYQEDYFFYSRLKRFWFNGWLLVVMDGHNGREAADFCANEIGRIVHDEIGSYGSHEALRKIIYRLRSATDHMYSGSTISLALIERGLKRVSVAVLGDSPVIVMDKNGRLHVSPEHNVRSNVAERVAAEKRGAIYTTDGYITTEDGEFGLQLSRSLGDFPLEKIISRDPEVYSIADPRWVLVASDGVFDPRHDDASGLIEELKCYAQKRSTAEDVMRWVEKRGLGDNATALVWSSEPSVSSVAVNFWEFLSRFGICR